MCWKGRLRPRGRGNPRCPAGGRASGLTPAARCAAPTGLALSLALPRASALGYLNSAPTRLLLGFVGLRAHLRPGRGRALPGLKSRNRPATVSLFSAGDLVLLQCYRIALLVHCTIGVPLLSCACTRLLPFGTRPHDRFRGGCYANDACLLRGVGICGGPLDF
jgi:hypothetical protein